MLVSVVNLDTPYQIIFGTPVLVLASIASFDFSRQSTTLLSHASRENTSHFSVNPLCNSSSFNEYPTDLVISSAASDDIRRRQ